jgi:leucyl aminopeptidase (aminopeptidase T)
MKTNLTRKTAHIIVHDIARLRENATVTIICGLHNKRLAEDITLESHLTGAQPFLWVFNEKIIRENSDIAHAQQLATLPKHAEALLEKSDVIIWLSQFKDFRRLPENVKRAVGSFWDAVDETVKLKPRLLVNLPSPEQIRPVRIDYDRFVNTFMKALMISYEELEVAGSQLMSKLGGKEQVHLWDENGTDLTFSIRDRKVGAETGTLKECYRTGRNCEVEVPSGEVYVAPIENSAEGTLAVERHGDYGLEGLRISFENGKIASLKAEKGENKLKRTLRNASGEKDRIAEFGIGTNSRMNPTGWSIYDEKTLGTAHIAIGNNTQLGGTNKASTHIDFVLRNPTIKADKELIMKNGKPTA